jgi:hypothetical protein
MIARLARSALASFTAWRTRRRLAREAAALARRAAVVTPEIVARRAEIERRRQSHRPVRRLLAAQRQAMTARLASELSVNLPDRRFQ